MNDRSAKPEMNLPTGQRDRRVRLALLRTVRDLRISIARRRPVTLPNLLRLLRRRLHDVDPSQSPDAAVILLNRLYRHHQPFRAPLGSAAIRELAP